MAHALAEWDTDQNLYLFTSLTAGSSHIVTATSRIETILRANRLHFTYVDTATNESARKLYGRRGRGKKLPILVKGGEVLGDLTEIEEWNEFGELKDVVGELPPPGEKSITTTPAKMAGPYSNPSSNTASPAGGGASSAAAAVPASPSPAAKKDDATASASPTAAAASQKREKENAPIPLAMRNIGAEAAAQAKERKKKEIEALKASLAEDKSSSTVTPAVLTEASTESSASLASSSKSPPLASPSSVISQANMREHRGSSISLASEDEIKQVEQASAIPEAPEEEEEEDEVPKQPSAVATSKAVSEETGADRDAASSADDDDSAAGTLSPQEKEQRDLRVSLGKISEARSEESISHKETRPTAPAAGGGGGGGVEDRGAAQSSPPGADGAQQRDEMARQPRADDSAPAGDVAASSQHAVGGRNADHVRSPATEQPRLAPHTGEARAGLGREASSSTSTAPSAPAVVAAGGAAGAAADVNDQDSTDDDDGDDDATDAVQGSAAGAAVPPQGDGTTTTTTTSTPPSEASSSPPGDDEDDETSPEREVATQDQPAGTGQLAGRSVED